MISEQQKRIVGLSVVFAAVIAGIGGVHGKNCRVPPPPQQIGQSSRDVRPLDSGTLLFSFVMR